MESAAESIAAIAFYIESAC